LPKLTWFECCPRIAAFLAALGEAIIIAGVLTLCVDPFLKFRLLKEAERGIFEHMLGFDHEPELKAKLGDIAFNTKLYRRNLRLTCQIEPSERPHMVRISLQAEHRVINPTIKPEKYTCFYTFEAVEKPDSCEFIQIIGNAEPVIESPPFKTVDENYLDARAKEVTIEPEHMGISHMFIAKCTCLAPEDWFHTLYFGLPTIDTTVSVSGPDGWEVWVEGKKGKLIWHDAGLKMTGEKISIHWRRGPVPHQVAT
jgi:hypothetical protein